MRLPKGRHAKPEAAGEPFEALSNVVDVQGELDELADVDRAADDEVGPVPEEADEEDVPEDTEGAVVQAAHGRDSVAEAQRVAHAAQVQTQLAALRAHGPDGADVAYGLGHRRGRRRHRVGEGRLPPLERASEAVEDEGDERDRGAANEREPPAHRKGEEESAGEPQGPEQEAARAPGQQPPHGDHVLGEAVHENACRDPVEEGHLLPQHGPEVGRAQVLAQRDRRVVEQDLLHVGQQELHRHQHRQPADGTDRAVHRHGRLRRGRGRSRRCRCCCCCCPWCRCCCLVLRRRRRRRRRRCCCFGRGGRHFRHRLDNLPDELGLEQLCSGRQGREKHRHCDCTELRLEELAVAAQRHRLSSRGFPFRLACLACLASPEGIGSLGTIIPAGAAARSPPAGPGEI